MSEQKLLDQNLSRQLVDALQGLCPEIVQPRATHLRLIAGGVP